ncbi:protein MMS22-like [Macrobrachium nipponense]|uniref:protein MMS22-like n=1 Tax=Macrobrachium nipponense TaxID=159736 RepID=UPI0030C856A5
MFQVRMSLTPNISMTPPLTPPLEAEGNHFGNDSLDYMDFFNTEMDASPVKEMEALDHPVDCGLLLFSCRGEARWTESLSDTSCIGKRVLVHLLQQKNPCSFSSDYTFYLPCTADNVVCNLEHYFLCVRQAVSELERGAQSNVCLSQSCHDAQYPKVREEVARFFNCLISHVITCGSENICNENFMKNVIAEILDLLLYMHPLHDLPEHVTSASSPRGNKSLSAAYHLLHLHLDIRWWSLILLYIIESNWGCLSLPATHSRTSSVLVNEPVISSNIGMAVLDEAPVFEQLISLVVWDLITIMCREGLKKSISDMHQVVGFSCTCSLELGVMVLHLLDHRHSSLGKQSFWDHVKNKILILLKLHSESSNNGVISVPSEDPASADQRFDIIQYPAPITRGVKLPHIWWIFVNFSRLYTYDNLGRQVQPKSNEIKSETKMLRTLVKLSVVEPRNGAQPTEVELRFFVRSCLVLHSLWGGERSSEWASSLWDYFSKHLDSSFLLPGAGVEGLACMSKTVGGWLEQVKSRISDPDLFGKSESSWQIFLRIVVGVVQSGNLEWRQMRGRIYSKFHGRKMLELSPVGLHNSITLFLCLANTTDMVDVTNKLCELLMMAPSSSVSKSKVVWRGFLTTILLLVESGCNIAPITEKFSPLIASACQEYITSRDAMLRRDYGQLIILYAEGIQEIFEHSSDLTLGQHSLLCTGLSSVLQHCGIPEMKAILLAVNSALIKVLSNAEKFHCFTVRAGMEVIETIWKEFGIFIKSQATVLTPPAVLGSVAASLTLSLALYHQNNIDGMKETPSGLFIYFLSNEAVNATCSQQYLHSLLSDPSCLAKISQVCPTYEVHLVANWLSSLVTLGDTEELLTLTPLITSLPGVSEVCQPLACPFTAAKAFVKGVGRKFSNLTNFSERMAYRDVALQYFSSLDKAFGALLKKLPLPEYLSSAMELFASIIYHCHSVIYIKSRPTCPLPSLISTVILPTNVYSSEKPLSSPLLAALTPNMPKILCGLGYLSVTQDPYIMRCVKDIFTHYMHRFPVKTNKNYITVTHPFIMCLHDADIQEENLHDLRSTFLEVVRDNYFEKPGVSNVHHQIVISLLLEIMARNSSEWVTRLTTVLLHPLLELLLAVEDQVTKRMATDYLQKLLMEAQEQNSPSRGVLVKIIRKFVLQHVSWSSHRLFRVLGVMGITCRPLLVDCLPDIAYAVRKTEEKRGTGLDHTLRQGYNNLLTSLAVNEDEIEDTR